jgi:hypothetical protein
VSRVLDGSTEHAIKNHLAIIIGFCELVLNETPPGDSRHADLQEILRAARELMIIFRRDPVR